MPTLRACATLFIYWLLWLLIVNRYAGSAFHASKYLEGAAWVAGTTLLAAWFTWVELVDDAVRRKYGTDSEDEDAPAHPAVRFLGAVTLTVGAMGAFSLAAAIPLLRIQLFFVGLACLVLAVVTLFFGRRGSDDIDLD